MTVPPPESIVCRCMTTKVPRPDRCVMSDGDPCSACAEDIALEQELENLEKLREKIYIKRRALRAAMNENHDRLIRRFPPEIASRIFFHYSLANPRFNTYGNTNTLFLGAVCQRWRQLAWATPELWTSIYIGKKIMDQWTVNAKQLLTEWLERSASLELTIRFLDPSNSESVDGVYRVVTDLLNRHSARWYDIHFDIPTHHLHRLCGASRESILHRLAISSSTTRSNNFPPSEAAPSTFRMECSPSTLRLASLSLIYVDIMWNNLTVVHLSSLVVDEIFEVLRRSPRLTTITLSNVKPPSGAFYIPDTRFSCPHVRSLELLHIASELALEELLNSVCFPSLVQWTLQTYVFPLSTMVSFIQSSGFRLKAFRVIGTRELAEKIHDLLRHLRSIEVMQLRFWFHDRPPATEVSFFTLLCSLDETEFLPHLRTLNFGHVPLDSIPRIFSASHRRDLRLEVDFHSASVIEDGTAERFLELVDEGFNLSILRCGEVDVIEEYKVNRRSH